MRDHVPIAGPVLYAHRGAPLEVPENSLPSLARALELGADALEIDVHMSSDGHVVVAHDASGARTAQEPREIRGCTLTEIKRWDLSRGFALGESASPTCMPTLDEVLESFPRAVLNVDLKQLQPVMVEAVLSVVARHAAAPRVLLTSFSSAVTRRVRALGYPGPTGFGRAEVAALVFAPKRVLARVRNSGTRVQIPLRYGPVALDRAALIAKLHALGLAVDYWVVNDASEAQRLLALGADGIVTDDVRMLADVFARSAHTATWRERHPAFPQRA